MILQRGITGFFNCGDRGVIHEFGFEDFKRVVFAVAGPFSVSNMASHHVTPNFHSALLISDNLSILILGHSSCPLFAFAEPMEAELRHLKFIDCDLVSDKITRFFPEIRVATAGELCQRFTETDLAQLDFVEREQISYWQPKSVGEIAFNWWD